MIKIIFIEKLIVMKTEKQKPTEEQKLKAYKKIAEWTKNASSAEKEKLLELLKKRKQ
jgi:hypothetical protein